jgi:hypothetical protein
VYIHVYQDAIFAGGRWLPKNVSAKYGLTEDAINCRGEMFCKSTLVDDAYLLCLAVGYILGTGSYRSVASKRPFFQGIVAVSFSMNKITKKLGLWKFRFGIGRFGTSGSQ